MFILYNTIASLVVFAGILLFLQQTIGWKATGGFFSGKDAFILLSTITGLVWAMYLILSNAIFYLIAGTEFRYWIATFVPLGIMIAVLLWIFYGDYQLKKEENRRNQKIKDKRQECIGWVGSLSFLNHPKKYDLSVYTSKDKAVGRIYVFVENDEQEAEAERRMLDSDFPEGIYGLVVRRKER